MEITGWDTVIFTTTPPRGPMADGDGPFAVIARTRIGLEFAVERLDEVRADDRNRFGAPSRTGRGCAPELVEVTAVTPADPASHPFSVWVLGEVRRACSG